MKGLWGGRAIRFQTTNSDYLFTWKAGDREGTLTCLSGTFAGDVTVLQVEPFRDLAWVGEIVHIPGEFRSTTIVTVDRSAAA